MPSLKGWVLVLAVKGSCNPSECNLECVKACQSVQGGDAPLTISNETGRPSIRHDRCTACLLCARACPLNAIEIEGSTAGAPRTMKRRKRTTLKPTAEQPYEVADDFARFSEVDMILPGYGMIPTLDTIRRANGMGQRPRWRAVFLGTIEPTTSWHGLDGSYTIIGHL